MIANVSILLIATLCILYAGINAYAALHSRKLIFPAPPSSYQDDASILKLQSSAGMSISAYYLKASNSDRILIYSHGNGEDIGMARPWLQNLQQKGISVFAYDYPGYGYNARSSSSTAPKTTSSPFNTHSKTGARSQGPNTNYSSKARATEV